MKEIDITRERRDLLEIVGTRPQENSVKISYPEGYEGVHKLSDLYRLKKDEFIEVDKVVFFEVIWSIGSIYVFEYEIDSLTELENCNDRPADYIYVNEIDGERIMFVYNIG